MIRRTISIVFIGSLCACGQKGPLYMPESAVVAPVPVNAPAPVTPPEVDVAVGVDVTLEMPEAPADSATP